MYSWMVGLSYVNMAAAMMILAWNVSGGHFNPALTVAMFVSRRDYRKDGPMAGLMIVGQFAGAFLGVFFGFLCLMAPDYMNDLAQAFDMKKHANVPYQFMDYILAPITLESGFPYAGQDLGYGRDGFTRNWQTFWAVFLCSILISLVFVSLKSKKT